MFIFMKKWNLVSMYLFIDESGDTGCKWSATQYFVISVVIFNNIYDL